MKLKVCGVRNMAMVQACQDNSVDYIGFNFVPNSKRKITVELAQTLSHSFTGRKVGVFMDQSAKEILEVLSIVDLDIIQLHGSEKPQFITQLQKAIPRGKTMIWKALSIDENFDILKIQQYSKNCDLLLLDGEKPGSGNQIQCSKKLSQAIEETAHQGIDYGLAGGINIDNARGLLEPYADATIFDTASGVETHNEFDLSKLKTLKKLLHDD